MTTLTLTQVQKLLTTVSKSVPDQLNCDSCFELMAAFADAELCGDEPSDALNSSKDSLQPMPLLRLRICHIVGDIAVILGDFE